jgi:prephenate dehydratase
MSSAQAPNNAQIPDPENTIAFMGVEGANADLACRRQHPYMNSLPLPSFEAVFEAVEQGRVKYGIIPIENSQAGRVAEIHNLLPASNVHIVAEHIEPVEHYLYSVKGAKLEGVKTVYSHHQALMQCRKFVLDHKLDTQVHSNTATAARDVGQWKDPSKAAICSTLAGELYQLERLAGPINDAVDNATLFVTIARDASEFDEEAGGLLTTILFTLRNIPAALYKSLGGFATNGVNIVKLESYIKNSAPGVQSGAPTAQFFMTFEGHPRQRPVQLALEELGFFTQKTRVLGVYPQDKGRR